MYVDLSLTQFVDRMASKTAMPAGACGAAVAGSAAAALVSRTCRRATGDQTEALRTIRETAEGHRRDLLALAEADAAAFNALGAAYREPKRTAEEHAARAERIREGLVAATEVPLRIFELCQEVAGLATTLLNHGDSAPIEEARPAAVLAEAAEKSARLIVEANLRVIDDAAEVARFVAALSGAGKEPASG